MTTVTGRAKAILPGDQHRCRCSAGDSDDSDRHGDMTVTGRGPGTRGTADPANPSKVHNNNQTAAGESALMDVLAGQCSRDSGSGGGGRARAGGSAAVKP